MARTPLGVKFEPALLKELKIIAKKENRALNNLIETILLEYVKNLKEGKAKK